MVRGKSRHKHKRCERARGSVDDGSGGRQVGEVGGVP